MCSIYGAIGDHISRRVLDVLAHAAKDRGRDGGRVEFYESKFRDRHACLGNWRATPTPELEVGALQPYDGMVHNGTIANDVALGAQPGEIDSQVLARVIVRENVHLLAESLERVQGSYALACWNGRTVLAATNYKPLYYARVNKTIYFSSMARHFRDVLTHGQAPVRLEPYTAMDLSTGHYIHLKTTTRKRAVVIASAGLDSTVAAAMLVQEGYDVCLLHFVYGCNAEKKETMQIARIADALGCSYHFMSIDFKQQIGGSTLFSDVDMVSSAIEGAEYAHEWVPARNLVFISLAIAWAESNGYHAVALGNNLEEAGAYPDNEEEFTTLLNNAAPYAVQAHYGMRVLSPVGNLMKHEIVAQGLRIGAPLGYTWSCYRGGDKHCGVCGPCFMRKKAFERNGAKDPVFL